MTDRRIAFQTFGCKLNFAETSTISRQMQEEGYKVVDYREEADVYVIHSCAVTAQAEKKCRAAIRQAKKRNPSSTVAVVGCFPQMKAPELEKMPEADLLVGTEEKFMLGKYLKDKDHGSACQSFVGDIRKASAFTPSWSAGDRTRSFLKIQDGCDYFCTYCTIPYARGRSRSATIADVIAGAHEIAAAGMKELVLTGVNIGDFGKAHGESFFGLMKALDTIDGIDRIRISSIEPDLLSEEMISFVASSNNFLPHFHIPLQSGADKILKAMNRKYTRDVFARRVEEIRKHMPPACIAADVITGFPGETHDDFRETYDFLERTGISYMHVFTYSERPGTKAVQLDGRVGGGVKRERSRLLHALSDKKKTAFYKDNAGTTRKVLFESDNTDGYMHGFTDNYIKVKTRYDSGLVNSITEVGLDHPDGDNCYIYIPK